MSFSSPSKCPDIGLCPGRAGNTPSFIPARVLIRSETTNRCIDVSSCSCLRVLGFPHSLRDGLVSLDCDHPVEHIWLYAGFDLGNPRIIKQLSRRLPKISRITVLLVAPEWPKYRKQTIDEFREMKLDSFGMMTRPIAHYDAHLVIERDTVQGRVLEDLAEGSAVVLNLMRCMMDRLNRVFIFKVMVSTTVWLIPPMITLD